MMKLIAKTAIAVTLTVGVFTTAHAESVTIKISDLRLSDPAQMRTLHARVDKAARRFCFARATTDLPMLAACQTGVKVEAMDKLSAIQSRENFKVASLQR